MALQTKIVTYGSLAGDSVSNGYILELQLTEQSVEEAANSSYLTYVLRLRSGSYHRFSQYRIGAKVVLDGVTVLDRSRWDSQQYTLGFQSSVELAAGSLTMEHDPDGSKTVSVTFSIDMEKSSYTPGAMTVTGEYMTLTPIGRESTVAATAADIGQVSILTVNRRNSGYTHTIGFRFGSLWGYLNSAWQVTDTPVKLTDTTLSFRIPESFYNEIPDSPTGVCALEITTFSGQEQVGQPKSAEFTVRASEAVCRPEIVLSVRDENPVTLALTGDEKTLVRFVSTAVYQAQAEAKRGAWITGIAVNGQPMTGDTLRVPQAEAIAGVCVATDSRGYTATATDDTARLIPYKKLTNNSVCHRLDPTSGQAALTLSGQVFWGSFGRQANDLVVTYQVNGGETQVAQITVTDGMYQGQALLSDLDYRTTHTVTVTVSDAVMTVTKALTVGKGLPVFDWGETDFRFHVPVDCRQGIGGIFLQKAPKRVFLPLGITAFLFSGSTLGMLTPTGYTGGDGILVTTHLDRQELNADAPIGILSTEPITFMEEIL